MPALIDENQSFQDVNGKPIVNGFVYVGLQDADTKANLISIFSDRELSVALANPQRTDSFGKSVNKIWVPGRHSLLVEDENNAQKLSDPDSGEEPSIGITSLTNEQIISNAITANAVPAITAYVDKQEFALTLPSSLTGASTLDIDGVGVVVIKNQDIDIQAGQFLVGKLMVVAFNAIGPVFEVINNSFNGVLHSPLDTNGFPVNTSRSTVASAATTADIWANTIGNEIDFTGAATVTTFPNAPRAGASRILHCAGAVVFTNNTTLFVQGAANFTASAGDVVHVHAITISTFRITILKEDGTAIIQNKIGLGTIQTASGTSVDFTSIPAGTKKVIIMFDGISLNSSNNILVQIGDSGGIKTTGYISTGTRPIISGPTAGGSNTAGFIVQAQETADALHGHMMLTLMDEATNLWISSHSMTGKIGIATLGGGGSRNLSTALTQIRVISSSGNTFDAGRLNIQFSQ